MKYCNIILEPNKETLRVPFKEGYKHSADKKDYSLDLFIDIINKRLKVDWYKVTDFDGMINHLEFLAQKNELTKILIVAKENDWKKFFFNGYTLEAIHPTFFRGEPGFHMSRFLAGKRRNSDHWDREEEIIQMVKNTNRKMKSLSPEYNLRKATKNDSEQLINLFKEVFETYPTPLTDKDYLVRTMSEGNIFNVIEYNGQIISAASLLIDNRTLSAELSDCATLQEFRGKGLMSHLISHLEDEAKEMNLITVYTLARATSPGINKAFARHNYRYCGRLVKNCDICGNFEDMNLWSKKI